MSQNSRGLLSSVLWRVLPLSIATLIAIWMVVIERAERSLEEETHQRIEQRVEGLVLATDGQISNILFAVRNLAANSLMINALIYNDIPGEEGFDRSYLEAYLRSLRLAGLREVELKVLDYRGRVLVGSTAENFEEQRWVDTLIAGGEHLEIHSKKGHFYFATPIEYNGSPEGILLLEVESKVLLEYLGSGLPLEATLLRSDDYTVLYSGLWGVDDELEFLDPPHDSSELLESEMELRLFPAITVRYSEDRAEAFSALDNLHNTLLIVLILDLIALVIGIVVAARSVIRPITHITQQLHLQERQPDQVLELKQEGLREVDQLASTYNRMQRVARELNQKVKEQYETMDQVFSSMADALLVLDRQGMIVEVNPAATELLKHTAESLLQAPVSNYVEIQQEGEVMIRTGEGEKIPALLAESHSGDSRYQIWVLHDLRERIYAEQQEQYSAFQAGIAEMGASVIHNIGNAITGMVGNINNIDKQTKMVERLSKLLANQGERMKQAPQEEQERTQLVLAQSSEVLGKVVSKEEGIGGYLGKLNHAIRHVGEVISIQQSAARPNVHASQFRLESLLRDTMGLIQDSLDKRRITLETDLEKELPRLFLPKNPMIQLLLNLLKNSMEAIVEQMRQDPQLVGEIKIVVRSESERFFVMVVEDNGCGLDLEQQDAIFQSHFSTKERGSGYGLHSAGNFVTSLGGKIHMESEGAGKGAKMVILLPFALSEEGEG